jgi:hypothetical protein
VKKLLLLFFFLAFATVAFGQEDSISVVVDSVFEESGISEYFYSRPEEQKALPDSTKINNRSFTKGVNTWSTSTAGTSNASACELSGTLFPPSGLVYTFSPVLCSSHQNILANNNTKTTPQLTCTYYKQSNT